MKINSNITAYTTNNAYLINERRLSNATTRLSSGFKINKAGDDPANYAIGSKMRSQLESLDKVKTNATTGTSVLETAESAISEIQSMLQRMNELAIKASNTTVSDSDRKMIQEEVDELKKEVTRIRNTTEFNGMNLLDGTFENKGYCRNYDSIKIENYSEETIAGAYSLKLDYEEGYSLDTYSLTGDVYGVFQTVFPKVSEVERDGDIFRVTVSSEPEGHEMISRVYEVTKAELDANGGVLADIPDIKDPSKKITLSFEKTYTYTVNEGSDKSAMGIRSATDLLGKLSDPDRAYYTSTRTISSSDGSSDEDYVTVTSKNGTEVTFRVADRKAIKDKDLEVELTGKGALRLQVGVEEGEVLPLSLTEMSLSNMHIDDLDLTSVGSATKGIDKIRYGLDFVSSVRSKIGAYENRLENTLNYVDASDEALTTSFSRITDTDMAEEMTEYTNLQVLTQAGMSMLAQANEFPQQALQLLS